LPRFPFAKAPTEQSLPAESHDIRVVQTPRSPHVSGWKGASDRRPSADPVEGQFDRIALRGAADERQFEAIVQLAASPFAGPGASGFQPTLTFPFGVSPSKPIQCKRAHYRGSTELAEMHSFRSSRDICNEGSSGSICSSAPDSF
jgi:hypothetical protein